MLPDDRPGSGPGIDQWTKSLATAAPTKTTTTTKVVLPTDKATAVAKASPGNTAAPKPTAGSAAQKPRYPVSNAPLNPRAETQFLYGQDAFGLRRGAIIRTHRDAANANSYIQDPKNRYTFRFLYNPSEITFSNQSFNAAVPPEYKNTNDNLVPLFVGQEQVSFSLLLDRTQDAYEQGLPTRGTLDDIEALYRVVNGDFGSSTGYISLSAVEIHWGPSTQNGRPLPIFPCYITSITVTHTQFTPRMCPIRSAIQISAARLVGAAGSGLGESGKIGA